MKSSKFENGRNRRLTSTHSKIWKNHKTSQKRLERNYIPTSWNKFLNLNDSKMEETDNSKILKNHKTFKRLEWNKKYKTDMINDEDDEQVKANLLG